VRPRDERCGHGGQSLRARSVCRHEKCSGSFPRAPLLMSPHPEEARFQVALQIFDVRGEMGQHAPLLAIRVPRVSFSAIAPSRRKEPPAAHNLDSRNHSDGTKEVSSNVLNRRGARRAERQRSPPRSPRPAAPGLDRSHEGFPARTLLPQRFRQGPAVDLPAGQEREASIETNTKGTTYSGCCRPENASGRWSAA
jgi:hypothetical protein